MLQLIFVGRLLFFDCERATRRFLWSRKIGLLKRRLLLAVKGCAGQILIPSLFFGEVDLVLNRLNIIHKLRFLLSFYYFFSIRNVVCCLRQVIWLVCRIRVLFVQSWLILILVILILDI